MSQFSSMQDIFVFCVWSLVFALVMYNLMRSIRIVPQRFAMIVERLGKYHMTLNSGFHLLIPFIDKVPFIVDLKEESINVPPQECFTNDEIRVIVDGIIYISVIDPVKASYGITNYKWAAMQLAQTTTRAIIGKLALDKSFEERDSISQSVVEVLEQTGSEWGIMVHRYEIKNISPPKSVNDSMEKQVKAERERHAILARSEGQRQSSINISEGKKIEMVNASEGEKQKRINEAEGKASEIIALANATAESIEKITAALAEPGGELALDLQLKQRYLDQVGGLGREGTEIILPMDLGKLDEVVSAINLSSK